MFHKFFDNGQWGPTPTGWEPLGGRFHSPPAVVSWAPGRLDIFALGLDNQMFHKFFDKTWGPSVVDWEAIGGVFNSAPAAVSWAPGRLDIFGLGTDNQMYHKFFDREWGPSLTDWEAIGGQFDSAPAAVSWQPGRLDIFGLGVDDQMFHKFFDTGWGPSLTGWEPIGGRFDSAPTALSWGPGRLDIVAFGTNDEMFHKFFEGVWGPTPTGWETIGGRFIVPAEVIPPPPLPSTNSWHVDLRFADSTPLGGFVDLVADKSGAFTFSGHMHDSGFDPISFSVATAIITPGGQAFGFGFSGKCGGTFSGGSRDTDWSGNLTSSFKDGNGNLVPNPNPAIAANWDQVAQGRMFARITAQDLIAEALARFVSDSIESMVKQLGAAGTTALIAIL
jgi:hypothetical protein